ncbi:MAG: ATP-binding protein [Ginsengibacter sp.]
MHEAKEEAILTIIAILIVIVFLGILFLVLLARHNSRRNRLIVENEKIKKQFAETLLTTQLEIQEHTFNYISHEIHDNIGQVLSLVRLRLNSLGSQPEEKEIAQTDELLGQAIGDLRNLSHSFNADSIQSIGIIESVRDLLSQFERTGKFATFFYADEEAFVVNVNNAIILFRIIQESLNNIVRHSNADEISIKLQRNGDVLETSVSDNGNGFNTNIINKKHTGIGLKNMVERCKIIGAKFSVESQPGKGTLILISIKASEA